MAARSSSETTRSRGGESPSERPIVGVFARHPTPGETKTRLAARIGNAAAAAVAEAMWETTLRRLESAAPHAARLVAVTPCPSAEWFAQHDAVIGGDWSVVAQPDGDLGERMHWFFEALAVGRPAMLLGADCPHFPSHAVADGLAWLADGQRRAVVAPAEDGGYWAVGVAGEPPPIFGALPWSQPELLGQTLGRLDGWRAAGEGDFRTLGRSYDIDTADDLDRLRDSLPAEGCPELHRLSERLDALLGPMPASDPL